MFDQPAYILILSIFLGLFPFIFAIATSYLKINIVLSLIKNALGAQQVPSGMIIMALSIALTMMIMQPVFSSSMKMVEDIDLEQLKKAKPSKIVESVVPALTPWKEFLSKHASQREIAALSKMRAKHLGEKDNQDNFFILLTAFLLSELKEAFFIGLVIILPFVLIDFIVANLLAGLGMYMFSPVLLSLPIKVFMIVAFDFWRLIFQGLFMSYA